MKLQKKTTNILYWSLFVFLIIIMGVALFGKLGEYTVSSCDEATHGVNAYEMVQNNNLWINTLRYEVDYYNTKPPLVLWFIALGYKLFGYTPLGMRFFSALFGVFTYFLAFTFVYKNRGRMRALLFAAMLPACTMLFEFHMFRSGDMDSIYTFFFLIAMIALYKACDNIKFLLLYGAGLGLAFMSKSTHVATILAIGVIFLPYLIKIFGKSKAIIYYLVSYLVSAIIVLPWIVVRYNFDGLQFFSDILFDETLGRVQGSAEKKPTIAYFSYLIQLFKEPICVIIFCLIFAAIIIKLVQIYQREQDVNIIKNLKEIIIKVIQNRYLYLNISWFVVVVGIYSITKAGLEWYIYSAYIPLILLGIEATIFITKYIKNYKEGISFLLPVMLMIASVMISLGMISDYPWKGHGGNPRNLLYETALNVKENIEWDLSKKVLYIENSNNLHFEYHRWEHDYMFYALVALDVFCKDGGVNAFLETDDKDVFLILDKKLWDTYAPVLTGYVIIEDSDYLVFSKLKYEEL